MTTTEYSLGFFDAATAASSFARSVVLATKVVSPEIGTSDRHGQAESRHQSPQDKLLPSTDTTEKKGTFVPRHCKVHSEVVVSNVSRTHV